MRRVFLLCGDAWHDRSGVAALEFALSASVLVTFIIATVEVSNAIRVRAKLEVTAGQLAEFVAGQSSVVAQQWSATAPSGSLADLCNGAAMNLLPYSGGALSADIVSLSNDHPSNRPSPPVGSTSITVNTYLDWESTSACATTASSSLALAGAFPLANAPTSLLTKSGASANSATDTANLKYGYSAIVVKAQYSYANVLTFFLGQTINFSAVAVARPRSNATIQCTKANGTSC